MKTTTATTNKSCINIDDDDDDHHPQFIIRCRRSNSQAAGKINDSPPCKKKKKLIISPAATVANSSSRRPRYHERQLPDHVELVLEEEDKEEEEEQVEPYVVDQERNIPILASTSTTSITTTSGRNGDDDGEFTTVDGGLRLLGILLRCAEAVSMDKLNEATDLLPEISQLSSPFGSSPQRVAAYFAQALQARIISCSLGTYAPFDLKTQNLQKIFNALQSYNSISPLIKFSHFTANQAIFQALENEERIHIIDLDIMQGLQWPGLFHILATNSSTRSPKMISSSSKRIRSMRITGVGSSMEMLQATGRRLSDFATSLGLPFKFQPLEGKVGDITDLTRLRPRGGGKEATVVHLMHHCLYDITGSDHGTLNLLKVLRPKLITMVEQDLSHGGSFLGRFVEALHYYSALFDAVDDDGDEGESSNNSNSNWERHQVEQQLFSCEIRNIVAVGGPKRTGEVKVERWGDELKRIGFRPISLGGNPSAQASLLLGMFPWKGFNLVEEAMENNESGGTATGGVCLKLGWKDLSLLTASAWEPSS